MSGYLLPEAFSSLFRTKAAMQRHVYTTFTTTHQQRRRTRRLVVHGHVPKDKGPVLVVVGQRDKPAVLRGLALLALDLWVHARL